MDEFPSNSQTSKPERPSPEEKNVQKVITGEAVRRKTPVGRKILETFLGGDARSVGKDIWFGIIIPEAKDLIVNVIKDGTDRSFYGADSVSGNRGRRHRPGFASPTGHVNYTRYSSSDPRDRPDPRSGGGSSSRRRSSKDIGEIVLGTRVEADAIIDGLIDLIDQYEMATVLDLYEMIDWPSNPTDEKWGWTSLTGAEARRVTGGGYAVVLPKPIAI